MASLFDIIGPVMIGPSSSHTAGAVRIGLVTRQLLNDEPVRAQIGLFGSFAATGRGHGTDKALCAGLLGMKSDDERIPQSLTLAKRRGMTVRFEKLTDVPQAHPNTAVITATGKTGKNIVVQASSLGGGRIMINKIDGIDVQVSGEMHTLIVHNYDVPGHVALVTGLLHQSHINIATMNLYRKSRGGYSVMVLETDQRIDASVIHHIAQADGIIKTTWLEAC